MMKKYKSNNKKQSRTQLYTKICLIILCGYLVFSILFPKVSLFIFNISIFRVILAFISIYFIINIKKIDINNKKIKQIIKNYINFINKYILAKAITILIFINIITNIINMLIENISTK